MIDVGGNKFQNVAIPLIFLDRYFLVESVNGEDLWTVFAFKDGEPIIEILRNKPQNNPISNVVTNPSGIITVTEPSAGAFLYKVRPGSNNSSIFGSIRGNETEIRISDREIKVGTNVFQNNIILGMPVGIHVMKDGSIAMGAQFPPEFRKLISK
ncbi:MAG TPA: hypothetical protein PK764_03410 [Deltaproteobacteria bacterium]|jgi:hypothetical protein|nr:hypothetical protein [Deltaproteobacteria bacterium]